MKDIIKSKSSNVVIASNLTTFKIEGTLGDTSKKVAVLGGTGFSGKIVFFHNSLQSLPRIHRCKRPSKLSTQCENAVTPIGW